MDNKLKVVYYSGQLYMIMEYCENDNLKDYLSKNSAGFLNEVEISREPLSSDGYLTPTRNAQHKAQIYLVSLVLLKMPFPESI